MNPARISQEIEEAAKQEVCGDGHAENSTRHSHVDPIGLTLYPIPSPVTRCIRSARVDWN